MSSIQLRRLRQHAFEKQNHHCYYCQYPMWDSDFQGFSHIQKIPLRLAKYLRCTAEHLVARRDGGQNTADNIVAACVWCNSMRHSHRPNKAPDAATYRRRVLKLISLGRGHPLALSKRAAHKDQPTAQVNDLR